MFVVVENYVVWKVVFGMLLIMIVNDYVFVVIDYSWVFFDLLSYLIG